MSARCSSRCCFWGFIQPLWPTACHRGGARGGMRSTCHVPRCGRRKLARGGASGSGLCHRHRDHGGCGSVSDVDHKAGAVINSLAPMVGMALGAIGAGVLIQFRAAALAAGLCADLWGFPLIQILRTLAFSGDFPNRTSKGLSLRPKVEIPTEVRGMFLRIIPLNVAVWGLGALFLSLLPGLLHEMATGPSMAWLSGAAVGILTLAGAGAVMLFRDRSAASARNWAGLTIIAGTGIVLLGALFSQPCLASAWFTADRHRLWRRVPWRIARSGGACKARRTRRPDLVLLHCQLSAERASGDDRRICRRPDWCFRYCVGFGAFIILMAGLSLTINVNEPN